jgi:WbqC-like protein
VRTPIVLASTLDRLPGGADDRLIALCRRFGCRTYLAGAGGQDYMEIDAYRRAGIAVEFQEFRHPVYPQAFPGFEPDLSAVDLLMSAGTGAIARVRETREVAA